MSINDICIIVIIAVAIIEALVVFVFKINHKLVTYKRVVDYFPSSLSTLGVLGTFIGIYIGLKEFDPYNIQASIPKLLDGLKTAFSTSLWGLALSLTYSFVINILTDQDEKQNPTEFDKLAVKISDAVDEMSRAVVGSMERVRQQIDRQTQIIEKQHIDTVSTTQEVQAIRKKIDTDLAKISSCVGSLTFWAQEDLFEKIDEINTEVSVCRLKLTENNEYLESVNMEEEKRTTLLNKLLHSAIEEVQGRMLLEQQRFEKSMLEGEKLIQTNLQQGNDLIQERIVSADQKLKSTLIEGLNLIEARLTECDALLNQKLEVFGTSIAKSNTEALSSVMSSACASFQSTMNQMLGQLIKDNFAELNKNIGLMDHWQKENFELIDTMINKCHALVASLHTTGENMSSEIRKTTENLAAQLYGHSKQMADNISSQYSRMSLLLSQSTASLAKVAEYTREISGEEGELGNLVHALKEVIINDQSFLNVSKNLTSSIAKNTDNIELLNNIAIGLKSWMANGQKMQDEIRLLIGQLNGLNQMRDFNNQFWSSAKHQLEDGIRILQVGSNELNRQLNVIDQHFYDRLSVTLANLDECIAKMIEAKKK